MTFNKQLFEVAYESSIDLLKKSEDVTKRELRGLSRSVLEATHSTENIDYINKLLTVLSPVNRRACVEFYKDLSGFHYDDKLAAFTKKDKKNYDDKNKAALKFLEDPLNNVWTWSHRKLKIEKFEPTIASFTKYVASFVNKTQNKFGHAEIVQAIFKAGISVDDVVEVLAGMEDLSVKLEGFEAPKGKQLVMDIAALM